MVNNFIKDTQPMIATLLASGVLGFIAPFLGNVVKMFQTHLDNKHELEVMKLRIQQGAQEHTWRMEEINAKADIAEAVETHRPTQSFGTQLLDKAVHTGWPAWTIVPVFWLFSFLDFITGFVRPTITYAMVGFYIAYRWACVDAMMTVLPKDTTASQILSQAWTDNDWCILMMVLTYWLGDRTRQKIMGKKG